MMSATDPRTFVLWRADFDFGHVPGPLAVATYDRTIWVAAGAYGEALILVNRGDVFRRGGAVKAHGLRAILPLSDDVALVCGEYGFVGRTSDGGESFTTISVGTRGCLYSLDRDPGGVVWLGGDDGLFRSADDGRSFSQVMVPSTEGAVVRVAAESASSRWVVRHRGVALVRDGVEDAAAFIPGGTLNDLALGAGTALLVGNGGAAFMKRGDGAFERVSLGTDADLERAIAIDGGRGWLVLSGSGGVFRSDDGEHWESTRISDGLVLTGFAPFGSGCLVGGWRKEGPPYRFDGALVHWGPPSEAPRTAHPIRVPMPVGGEVVDEAAESTPAPPTTPTEKLWALLLTSCPPDLDALRALLAEGADVNATDADGCTALMLATAGGADDVTAPGVVAAMDVLLASGARVAAGLGSQGDITGRLTNVHLHPELYRALLRGGATPDGDDAQHRPLHEAARTGTVAHATLLLDHGAAVNAIDGRGRTALAVATRERSAPWVAHNHRTADFTAVISLLEARGGVLHVPFEWDGSQPFAPRPFDQARFRAALPPDCPRYLRSAADDEHASLQDLTDDVYGRGEPEALVAFVRAVASTLGEPMPLAWEGDLSLSGPFFWHGDLVVHGNLHAAAAVIVTGNVRAHGVVTDAGNDSRVTIGGDLHCHGLFTDGDFTVGGTLEARDVVLGYYNDFVLAASVIRAPVVVEDDHCVMAEVESPHHFDIDRYARGKGVREELHALFVEEVFDEEGSLDNRALFRRIGRGERVFRERP